MPSFRKSSRTSYTHHPPVHSYSLLLSIPSTTSLLIRVWPSLKLSIHSTIDYGRFLLNNYIHYSAIAWNDIQRRDVYIPRKETCQGEGPLLRIITHIYCLNNPYFLWCNLCHFQGENKSFLTGVLLFPYSPAYTSSFCFRTSCLFLSSLFSAIYFTLL